MQISRAELIYTYKIRKAALTRAQEAEKTWRLLLATTLFDVVEIGTNWTPQRDVKLVTSINITLSKDTALITRTMQAAEKQFPTLNFQPLFRSKLEFVESEYNALPDIAKLAIAPLLTIKPGLPSIEIPEKA